MKNSNSANMLRNLPSIDSLLSSGPGTTLRETYGHVLAVESLRHTLDSTRDTLRAGSVTSAPDDETLLEQATRYLRDLVAPTLRPVINATGVIVHTNLGRAPLSEAARQAVDEAAAGYSTLEYSLEAGARGSRSVHGERLLTQLTGAEAALIVNNNAAAVLLTLTALASGRGAVISRGQLVEIGGGFRIPDVMTQSGAHLLEVGTTNRTHLRDYEAAIDEDVALLMRAHASNYKIIGFTVEPTIAQLAELAHAHGLLLFDDLGSGTLLDTVTYGLGHEPMVQESLAAGADVVSFSGDKLLGGPQAGIVVGRRETIEILKRHPLARAVRAGKMCLAGLAATLGHYLRGEALEHIPVWRMIAAPQDALRQRAERWAAAITDIKTELIDGHSTVGGGSLPGETLESVLLALDVESPDTVAAELRANAVPVIVRIEEGRVLLDPRTVLDRDEEALMTALQKLV